VPHVVPENKLMFTMLVMRELYRDRDFQKWIDFWVTGVERSAASAAAAGKRLEKETRVGDELEALAAWGEAGGNDTKAMQETNELVERALCLTRAAEKAATNPEDESIALDTARALSGIAGCGKLGDLQTLAERVVGQVELPDILDAA